MSLGWPGNASGSPATEELEEVSGVREVWASLLRLLPPGMNLNRTIWPAMDPADADTVRSALSSQGTKLPLHETQLNTIAAGVKQLTDRQAELQQTAVAALCRLTDSPLSYNSWSPVWRGWLPPRRPRQLLHSRPAPSAATSAPPPCPVRLAPPEKFSGESGECRPFLVQCDLHFKNDPAAFSSEQARVAFMVSHLTGGRGGRQPGPRLSGLEGRRCARMLRLFTNFIPYV
ncbi:hypothetical protein L3Q82_009326 [Scortum barcoo]|uniref:Uncharacterized protein n=1 Tax=Scortum barcoo TaxID=214431 RepID=A0ACB8WFM5_9TELE|nr:hypothetical protein L3Q82_009326 [Scortum barcoo]